MDRFAEEVAAEVAKAAPNWLIFVEGTSKSPNCTATIDGEEFRSSGTVKVAGALPDVQSGCSICRYFLCYTLNSWMLHKFLVLAMYLGCR